MSIFLWKGKEELPIEMYLYEFRLGKLPEQTYQEIVNSENSKNGIKHNYNCIFFSHETLES